MAGATWANAKGAAKRVVSELEKAQPFIEILGKRAKYRDDIKPLGKSYLIPVVMQPPNGVTYLGKDSTASSLLAGRPMNIQEAEAFSYELDVMEQTPWPVLERQKGGAQSVEAYLSILMLFLKRTAMTRKEVSMLLGQNGLGTVDTVTDNTTYATLKITAETWRGGLWWMLGPGATLDSMTTTTLNNATAPLVLIGVNPTARTIDVTYSGTLADECDPGDVLYPEGAYRSSVHYDMPGLLVQNANTTGTSLGLSATTYPNWSANTASVGGVFTEDAEEYYLGLLRNRGGGEGKMTVYLPEPTWRDRVAAHSTKRVFDSSYSPNKQTGGEQDFDYSSKRFGRVEHELHPFLADSEVMMQVDENTIVVGSRNPRLGVPSRLGPSGDEGDNLLHVPTTNYAESYASYDLGVVQRMPSSAQVLTGITH